jgi:BMFP domain-containing protein YqiC
MTNNSDMIDNLAEKISTMFASSGVSTQLKEDAQRNLRAVIQSAFSKLDIVTREEFDAQSAVLARTREKLDQLEAQMEEMKQEG